MKKSKILFILLLLSVITVFGKLKTTKRGASDGYWTSDYNAALEKSKKTGKPVYVLFTGSDWCGYCIKMEKTIYQSKEWKKIADEEFIISYFRFSSL